MAMASFTPISYFEDLTLDELGEYIEAITTAYKK